MRATVSATLLHAALKRAVTQAKGTMAILQHVLIQAAGNQLSIISTDLNIELTEHLEADVIEPGTITAEADKLQVAVSNINEDARLTLDGAILQVAVGRRRYKVNTLPADNFPEQPPLDEEKTQKVDLPSLIKGLRHVIQAAATDDHRAVLNTVHYEDGFSLGCNGMALAVANVPYRGAQFNIPTYNCKPALSLAEKAETAELGWLTGVKTEFPSRLTLSAEGFKAVVHLLDHPYHDWRRITHQCSEATFSATLSPKELLAAIGRAARFDPNKGRLIPINFEALQKTLTIKCNAAEAAEEEIDVEIQQKPHGEFTFKAAADLITTSLTGCDAEKIQLVVYSKANMLSFELGDDITHYIAVMKG